MKVAEVKLDSTEIQFYDDFANSDVQETNFNCFKNMIGIILQNIIIVV